MLRIQRALSPTPVFFLCALGFASLPAAAQRIPRSPRPVRLGPTRLFVVDDTPSPCRFSASLQAAVNAAHDGDVILLKSGNYFNVTIDGKSLSVIGEGSPSVNLSVLNLAADQRVVLRGLRFSGFRGLATQDNAGPLWVEDCVSDFSEPRMDDTQAIGVFRCQVGGFLVANSTLFGYHSTFQGRVGADAYFDDGLCSSSGGFECDWTQGSSGGLGLALGGASVSLFGSTLRGGDGGAALNVYCDCVNGGPHSGDTLPGGCGGNAAVMDAGSSLSLLQSTLVGGLPDCDGLLVSGTGTLNPVTGATGEFRIDSPVRPGEPLHCRIEGPPGRQVFLALSSEYTPIAFTPWKGYLVVPFATPDIPLGTLPSSGVLDVTQSFGNMLEAGNQARVIFVQAKLYNESNDTLVLGTPSTIVIVDDHCP